MYNFNIYSKTESTKNHLSHEDLPDTFSKGKFDPNDLRMSDLPEILKKIGDEKLKGLKKSEKLYFTETTTKTIEVEKNTQDNIGYK